MCYAQILFCVGQKKGFPGREKRKDKKGLLEALIFFSEEKIRINPRKSKKK
jgi:hypothetical protein